MRKRIDSFRDFEEQKKTIMNMFICEYGSPLWEECVSIFRSIDFPSSVSISGAHHRGLAFQILLDTGLEESEELANEIAGRFPQEPCIVLAEVFVKMKDCPIGEYQDRDLVGPGRHFDRLVREGKTGIFMIPKSIQPIVFK